MVLFDGCVFQAGNLLGGNATKENEMLARAGIKPRPLGLGGQPRVGPTTRTALGNLSNRNTALLGVVPGKPGALKDKEVSGWGGGVKVLGMVGCNFTRWEAG